MHKQATARSTLLCIVLSLILAEKRVISSGALYKHLEALEVLRTRPHTVFGNVEDVIAQFVKEEYLEKVPGDGSISVGGRQSQFQQASQTQQISRAESAADDDAYVWGPRAKVEYSEAEIASFVASILPESEAAEVDRILKQIV
ncbi:hypothetical protein HDU82_008329 [Entophlyctis luteolus]|nr:hypothetical protein HDU82_008329 [Entophlyctis luteolus]